MDHENIIMFYVYEEEYSGFPEYQEKEESILK